MNKQKKLNENLLYVCNNGNLETVKYLVDNGADVNYRYTKALTNASVRGNIDIVKYLVENGADIHARYDLSLLFALHSGHVDIVKYLIEKGCDVNLKGLNEKSYLFWVYKNNKEIINCLLEKGIEYEYLLNDAKFNQSSETFIYLKKYHDSKLLKDKLDKELKSTEVQTKRTKI